jgi:hypothetical protein
MNGGVTRNVYDSAGQLSSMRKMSEDPRVVPFRLRICIVGRLVSNWRAKQKAQDIATRGMQERTASSGDASIGCQGRGRQDLIGLLLILRQAGGVNNR